MKYFQIDGLITNDLLNKFIDFINENETEQLTLIIDSAGGKSHLTRFILDYCNKNAKRITLVCAGCYSAAFHLLYKSECKKQLLFGCTGMIHLSYVKDISVDTRNKAVFSEDKCQINNLKYNDDDFVVEFMNLSELKKYKSGKDVYFNFGRMKKIFYDAKVIK